MTAPLFLHSSPVDAESTRRSAASCHKAAPLPSCGAGEREEAARRPLKGAQGKRGRVAGPGRTTHACSLPCSLLVFLTHAAASAGSLKTAVFDPCSMCLQQRKPSGCQKKGERRRRREWPVGPPGGHFFRPCPPQCPSAVAVSQRLYCAS